MEIPVWLMWSVALLLAMLPMSILLIARSVDKVRPKKRRAKLREFIPDASCEGVIVISEEEAYALARAIAHAQMRQRWGKDIDWID